MMNMLFNVSGKIDQEKIQALHCIKTSAESLNIPFFIVGAYARDIILKHCYGLESTRRTEDIDLGVKVERWDQYDGLTSLLLSTGFFSATSKQQRLRFNNGLFVDIVPFGSIADEQKRIYWPLEHEIFMSLFGFQEAYEYSITVRLSSDPELDVKLPTLPGLTLIKLISWNENYPARTRDAEDIFFIMEKYEDAGNVDRLYNEEQKLLIEENFDVRLAAIRLLGHDMARIAEPDTLAVVRNILNSETKDSSTYRLAKDIFRTSRSYMFDENFNHIVTQIKKLRMGIDELP
ncbi:MAG: hypothetical protein NT072_10995 [Deltaproteobacteria bacterium]|nr:hypothetical protein [Deltaproteobacteria bacterium]